MNKETIRIGDRVCTIYQSEMPKFLLVQPIDEHDLEVLDTEVETIQTLTETPFTLVAFEIKDWQSELTPWAAPAVFGKIPFGDKAFETLGFQAWNIGDSMSRTRCNVCLEDIHWLAFLPYGQVISPRDLMALPLSRHPSGIHNG